MKNYSLRIQEKDFEKLKYIAKSNDRSINKQIERVIKNTIQEYEKINGEIKTI